MWDHGEEGGKPYFVTPVGKSTWKDPRAKWAFYVACFYEAEKQGIDLEDYFG